MTSDTIPIRGNTWVDYLEEIEAQNAKRRKERLETIVKYTGSAAKATGRAVKATGNAIYQVGKFVVPVGKDTYGALGAKGTFGAILGLGVCGLSFAAPLYAAAGAIAARGLAPVALTKDVFNTAVKAQTYEQINPNAKLENAVATSYTPANIGRRILKTAENAGELTRLEAEAAKRNMTPSELYDSMDKEKKKGEKEKAIKREIGKVNVAKRKIARRPNEVEIEKYNQIADRVYEELISIGELMSQGVENLTQYVSPMDNPYEELKARREELVEEKNKIIAIEGTNAEEYDKRTLCEFILIEREMKSIDKQLRGQYAGSPRI